MSTDSGNPQKPQPQICIFFPLSLTIAFAIVVLLIVALLALFILRYFKHLRTEAPWSADRTIPAASAADRCPPRGLSSSLISSFPTFTYASVKFHRHERNSLECAVCLAEFSEDDLLRLITHCCHVFHQDCIDIWLEHHTTCPVCRRDLDAVSDASRAVACPAPEFEERGDGSHGICAVRRSRSLGHPAEGEEDKFTLRVPRDFIMSKSCETIGYFVGDIETGRIESEAEAEGAGTSSSTGYPTRL